MANPRLFWAYPSDAGTFTASSEGYRMGAELLQTSHLAEVWGTGTSTAAETVTIDLGESQSIQAFALLGHDLTASDTLLNIAGNGADSWGSPAFTQAVTYRAGSLVEFFASAQSLRYWQFSFTKSASGEQRTAGRLLLGAFHEMSQTPLRSPHRWGEQDNSNVRTTGGGQRYSDRAEVLTTLELAFTGLDSDDFDELKALHDGHGISTPWIISLDHDTQPADWLLYGALSRLAGRDYHTYDGGHRWRAELNMVEAL